MSSRVSTHLFRVFLSSQNILVLSKGVMVAMGGIKGNGLQKNRPFNW
jgi:hypothetical protein